MNRIKSFITKNILKTHYPFLSPLYSTIKLTMGFKGVILMLHRVSSKDDNRLFPNENLKVAPDFLENLIIFYKKRNINFYSLEEVALSLKGKCNLKEPFVCLTFDDGYEDNFLNAYPILKRHNVPFTIFISSDFPDKKAILWWYSLEDLVLNNDFIELADGSSFECKTLKDKNNTFLNIREKILNLDQSNLEHDLNELFTNYSIDWFKPVRELSLSWEQIEKINHDPLCSIGGHTVSHIRVNTLSHEMASYEISEGIRRLENRLNSKINTFAFPYGSASEVSLRDITILQKLNLNCACIAYGGLIKDSANHLALPRIMLEQI